MDYWIKKHNNDLSPGQERGDNFSYRIEHWKDQQSTSDVRKRIFLSTETSGF